jgi:hypothetical protein
MRSSGGRRSATQVIHKSRGDNSGQQENHATRMPGRCSKQMHSLPKRAKQTRERSTLQRWRPSFSSPFTPRHAIRAVMPLRLRCPRQHLGSGTERPSRVLAQRTLRPNGWRWTLPCLPRGGRSLLQKIAQVLERPLRMGRTSLWCADGCKP